jgi:protein TonB
MTGNLVSAPQPGYPLLAKVTHTQGQVVLQAIVARDGTVANAHVIRGHHLLRGAAVDAVRRWRYRPYDVDGHPVEVTTTITVDFPSHR